MKKILLVLLAAAGAAFAKKKMEDAVKRARSRLPSGESLSCCEECASAIPEARRKAIPGVRLCVACQSAHDRTQMDNTGYNRRGSKDSQLR